MSSWLGSPQPRRENDPADDDGDPCQLHRRRVLVHEHDREQTAATGCNVSTTELIAAGARGNAAAIRSQPSTCDVNASVTSQAKDSQPVRNSRSFSSHPATRIASVLASVAWKSAPPERLTSDEPARSVSRKPA